jgi:methylglutaconyl-CoA hydratase
MTAPLVLVELLGPAAVLTLNRPEKRNALSRALVSELGARLSEAAADGAVRAVVLAATGPVFCAGLDLDELAGTLNQPDSRDRMQHDARQLAAVFRALATMRKPTIAAVQGPAVAGGAGLVTACDLAIATPQARFGYPEIRRGIMPAIITPMLLRLVPLRAAKQLLLVGNMIDADEAARLGVYNRVVSAEALRDTVRNLACDIALGGPDTIAATKEWMDRCTELDLWIESADASAAARFTTECEEGMAAFREKRQPRWTIT